MEEVTHVVFQWILTLHLAQMGSDESFTSIVGRLLKKMFWKLYNISSVGTLCLGSFLMQSCS